MKKLINFKIIKRRPTTPAELFSAFAAVMYELLLHLILFSVAFALANLLVLIQLCKSGSGCTSAPIKVLTWTLFAICFVAFSIAFLYLRTLIVKGAAILQKKTDHAKALENEAYWATVKREQKRLDDIKASMTPAEWAAYEIQLENNRLLEEIKLNQKNTKSSGPGFFYGISN